MRAPPPANRPIFLNDPVDPWWWLEHLQSVIRAYLRAKQFPRNDLDDVIQVVILRIYNAIRNGQTFPNFEDLRRYALVVAQHCVIDWLRKNGRTPKTLSLNAYMDDGDSESWRIEIEAPSPAVMLSRIAARSDLRAAQDYVYSVFPTDDAFRSERWRQKRRALAWTRLLDLAWSDADRLAAFQQELAKKHGADISEEHAKALFVAHRLRFRTRAVATLREWIQEFRSREAARGC